MWEWLKDWQVLASGVMALAAGAFVLLQGRMLIEFERKKEQREAAREMRATWHMIRALHDECSEMIAQLEEHDGLRQDFEHRYLESRGDFAGIRPPSAVMMPRVFELCLQYLSGKVVQGEILLRISDVIDKMFAFDLDYKEYLRHFDHGVLSLVDRRRQLSLGLDQPALDERLRLDRNKLIDEINASSGALREALDALQKVANSGYPLQKSEEQGLIGRGT